MKKQGASRLPVVRPLPALAILLPALAGSAAAQRAGEPLLLEQLQDGFGPLLPHCALELDANGLPTN